MVGGSAVFVACSGSSALESKERVQIIAKKAKNTCRDLVTVNITSGRPSSHCGFYIF